MTRSSVSVKVFISYSHKDESYKEALETHLTPLMRQEVIDSWNDRKIIPGDEWEDEIDINIKTSDLILLLISPDFIASDYCFGQELSIAMERHHSGDCVVVPIILRSTDFSNLEFSKLLALPTDGVPVSKWSHEDDAWLDVAKGLKKVVAKIQNNRERSEITKGPRDIRTLLKDELNRIDELHDRHGFPRNKIQTGINNLDRLTHYYYGADLVTIGARPSMGKSDFLLGIARSSAIFGNMSIGYFSLQAPAQTLIPKLVASSAHIESTKFHSGEIEEQDWPRISAAMELFSKANLTFNDDLPAHLSSFKEAVNQMATQYDCKAILLDSIQHLHAACRRGDRSLSPEILVRELKILSRQLKVPIFITSSLISKTDERPNKRPIPQDLGDWGILWEESDCVIFLYRDELYHSDIAMISQIELILAKNRNGPTGTALAIYRPERSSIFESSIDDHDMSRHS